MSLRRRLLLAMTVCLTVLAAAAVWGESLALSNFAYARSGDRLRDELRQSIYPARQSSTSPTINGTFGHLSAADVAVAVVDRQGRTVFSARAKGSAATNTTGFAVPADAYQRANGVFNWSQIIYNSGGHHLVQVSASLPAPYAPDVALLVGDLSRDDLALATAQRVTALSGAGALLIGVLLFLPLMATAMRPLNKVVLVAEEVGSGSLSARTGLTGKRGEIGRLALAFDNMVDKLQSTVDHQGTTLTLLEESEQRMRRFIADASHELRTPITSIQGAAQLLARGRIQTPEDLQEAHRVIEEQAARMTTLVTDLLALSRAESDPSEVADVIDVARLVATRVEEYRPLSSNHALTVTLVENAQVQGDPRELGRAITNLLENATKYSPAECPVEVGVTVLDESACIDVRDHGPGILEVEKPLVFDRFFRGAVARSEGAKGSGLGLAIVKAIVAKHGGIVSVADASGGGSVFRIALPIKGIVEI